MSNKRTDQVAEVIRRAIQSVINEGFGDPRLQGSVITVTRVTVDSALRQAVIYVGVMPENRESRTIHGLMSAAKHIRRRAGDLVSLRAMPQIEFKIDEQAKRQSGVLAALAKVREELSDEQEQPQEQSEHSQSNQPPPGENQ